MDVPGRTPSRRLAHVDTSVLRHAAGLDEDEDLKAHARSVVLGKRKLRACASALALGELILTLANDGVGRHRFVDGLDWLYQRMERGDLELFGVGPLQSPADVLATSLREADGRLEPVD